MKPESNTTQQDWLDIVWQSAIQAREKGLDIRFIDLGESVGIRIYGVVVRDGRPWLTATGELPPQSVKGDTHGGADTAIVGRQDA